MEFGYQSLITLVARHPFTMDGHAEATSIRYDSCLMLLKPMKMHWQFSGAYARISRMLRFSSAEQQVSVYRCHESLEDTRPQIDFASEITSRNDWLLLAAILDGQKPASSWPTDVELSSKSRSATAWDYFRVGGTRGLASERFLDVVGRHTLCGLSVCYAELNDCRYFFFRREWAVDCFDREHAVFDTFPHDASRIMCISQFAFHKTLVPSDACFCIPESKELLLTEPVARRIRDADLRGVALEKIF